MILIEVVTVNLIGGGISGGGGTRIGDQFCRVGPKALVRARMTMRGGKGGGSGAEDTKRIDSIFSGNYYFRCNFNWY